VLIKNAVVEEVFLFTGEHDATSKKAEEKFKRLCSRNCPEWNDLTADEIDEVLDDGYYEFATNNSVCITWPLVNDPE
ncbi:MAG: hypothetical protein ACRDHZ_12145, partial [Ktedonobacteraceae bacterium]